jgi:acyl-coenzyme A synthetase/AMP-(fatty) acid ligase
MSRVNFSRDVVDAAPVGDRALVEIARDGRRREWTFGEVSDASARLAGAFTARGVRRGDVVLTLVGNRPEWVLAMVACFRIGAVVLPCNEQLRAGDLRARLDAAAPRLVVVDERNAGELSSAGVDHTSGGRGCEVMLVPDPALFTAPPADPVALSATIRA